jgi:hypothetical protein
MKDLLGRRASPSGSLMAKASRTGNTALRYQAQGFTLLGLLFWSVIIGAVALIGMKSFEPLNEYWTVKRVVKKIAAQGLSTVPEVRAAFNRQKEIEYAIKKVSGKDLTVTKENDRLIIGFEYDSEVALVEPVYLLFKFKGDSR